MAQPIADFNRLQTSTTPLHNIGARYETPDGRKFRYALVGGTALVAGHMTQGPAIVANHQNVAVSAAAAIGATQVSATLGATAATANQYSGGYMVVNDATGEGHYYPITQHAAVLSGGVITVTLAEPIKVALVASTSEVSFIPNPWNGVIDYPTTSTLTATGVAQSAAGIGTYCWLQTGGPCNALADGAIGVMTGVAVPSSVAGAVKVMAATLSQVGYALQAGVDTEYRSVFLTID